MEQVTMERIVNGKRYSTAKATLLASDVYWDGYSFERHGRNTWLYRTYMNAYFVVTGSQWQGEKDSLTPITEDEARDLYEGRLSEHVVSYEKAFPTVDVQDA